MACDTLEDNSIQELDHGQQGAARQPREAQTEEREAKTRAAHLIVLRREHEARRRKEERRLAGMRRAPPTQADAMRFLNRLFALSPIDDNLISAVIDKLADKEPSMAMIVIELLLDEAGKRLPEGERAARLREFAELSDHP